MSDRYPEAEAGPRQEYCVPHVVAWDDPRAVNQLIDPGEMMRRLAGVLGAQYVERSFRGEPRYELRRTYRGGFELTIMAGHIYDTREALSMSVELRTAGMSRPVASYHLSNGLQRVKASDTTAWISAGNGTIVIVGEGLGGLIEVQN